MTVYSSYFCIAKHTHSFVEQPILSLNWLQLVGMYYFVIVNADTEKFARCVRERENVNIVLLNYNSAMLLLWISSVNTS
jgi:hypothetical protein